MVLYCVCRKEITFLSCLKGILLRGPLKRLVDHFASVLDLQMFKDMYLDTTMQTQMAHLTTSSSLNHYLSLHFVGMIDSAALKYQNSNMQSKLEAHTILKKMVSGFFKYPIWLNS